MRGFLGDFKKFLMRGNVLDLAVAVVVGAAFNSIVQSFANDVIMGFIGAVFGQPNFNDVSIHLGDGRVFVGKFFTSLVNFVIIAFGVFVAVKAFEKLQNLRRARPVEEAQDVLTVDQELLTEIRDLLRERA